MITLSANVASLMFVLHALTHYGTLLCKLSAAFSSKENPPTPNLQTKSRSQIGTLLFQSCQNPPCLSSLSYFERFDTSSRKPTFSRSLDEPSAEVRQRQSAGGPRTPKKKSVPLSVNSSNKRSQQDRLKAELRFRNLFCVSRRWD